MSVSAKDLIVSDATADFAACSRITHEIPMRPSVMKRMIFLKAYRDVTLTPPSPNTNVVDAKIADMQGTSATPTRPEDQPYRLWESQCELDLDQFIPEGNPFKGQNIPLPYLVTLDKDTREILAVRRDWDEADENCERKRMYVKYPYIPGPGFYGTGLLNVLGNSSAAMTAAWREALDAGMFASFPGGVIAKSANRQNTSTFRMSPGEFEPIDTGGLPIGQVIQPSPYRDVTPGLMAMMDKIINQAKEVGGTADLPAGEGLQNVPVGTMLANIEQATKIMAAAHKGMHTAQSLELELIIDLFRANPEDFWRSNKICQKDYWNEQKLLAALDNCNLVPVSDPNVPSHIHRVAKALGLVQLIQIPDFKPYMDAKETLLRCLRAMREDHHGIVIDPPPQNGPSEPDKLITAQAKLKDAETKAAKVSVDAAVADKNATVKLAEVQGRTEVARLDMQEKIVTQRGQDDRAAAKDMREERAQLHGEFESNRDFAQAEKQLQTDTALEVAKLAVEKHKIDKPPPKPSAKPKK